MSYLSNCKAQKQTCFLYFTSRMDGLESSVPEPFSIVYFFSPDKIPH
jgi:hypothetical protein